MAELGELRSRLDQAVEKLFNAQEARRLRNQRLMMVLTDFEAKNDALTRENTYLVGLIDRLILIIDKTANSEDESALERNSTMIFGIVFPTFYRRTATRLKRTKTWQ